MKKPLTVPGKFMDTSWKVPGTLGHQGFKIVSYSDFQSVIHWDFQVSKILRFSASTLFVLFLRR